jgi:hypothetical protein
MTRRMALKICEWTAEITGCLHSLVERFTLLQNKPILTRQHLWLYLSMVSGTYRDIALQGRYLEQRIRSMMKLMRIWGISEHDLASYEGPLLQITLLARCGLLLDTDELTPLLKTNNVQKWIDHIPYIHGFSMDYQSELDTLVKQFKPTLKSLFAKGDALKAVRCTWWARVNNTIRMAQGSDGKCSAEFRSKHVHDTNVEIVYLIHIDLQGKIDYLCIS